MPRPMVRSRERKALQTSWGEADGEVLQQSLGGDAGPDEDVTAVDLSLDGLAVLERLAVEMFVAVAAA